MVMPLNLAEVPVPALTTLVSIWFMRYAVVSFMATWVSPSFFRTPSPLLSRTSVYILGEL